MPCLSFSTANVTLVAAFSNFPVVVLASLIFMPLPRCTSYVNKQKSHSRPYRRNLYVVAVLSCVFHFKQFKSRLKDKNARSESTWLIKSLRFWFYQPSVVHFFPLSQTHTSPACACHLTCTGAVRTFPLLLRGCLNGWLGAAGLIV